MLTLLGDIGGTNARFAIYDGRALGSVSHRAVADFAGPADAIRDALTEIGGEAPKAALLAVAGPVEEGRASLTNARWTFDAAALEANLRLDTVGLVNDFAAQARAVPALADEHLRRIGRGTAEDAAPVAIIGPGTGLGVAGLIPRDGGPVVLVTEGGHVTMAPADAEESRLLDHLRTTFGHVSAERVLSGGGLLNLYRALAEIEGLDVPDRSPEEITQQALAGACPTSGKALDTFCKMLGTVAGNLALSLGAKGGVYLTGGIVPNIVDRLAGSAFRARFEAKGRFAGYLAEIPTCAVLHPYAALVGLAELARSKQTD